MLSGSDPAARPLSFRASVSRSLSGSASRFSRGRLAEPCSVDLTNDATQGTLGLGDSLPHSLGAWEEPWRRYRWRVRLAPELPERDTNDVRHPSPPLAKKLFVLHRLPSQRKRMLGTQRPHRSSSIQALPQTRNVLSRASTSDHAVLVPPNVSQIGDLIDTPTIPDSRANKPSFRKKMVRFARRAALRREGRTGSEETDRRTMPAFREQPDPHGMQVQPEPAPSAFQGPRLTTASSSRW